MNQERLVKELKRKIDNFKKNGCMSGNAPSDTATWLGASIALEALIECMNIADKNECECCGQKLPEK